MVFNAIWFQSFAQSGNSCADPIIIGSLPYETADNTTNYLDSIDTFQGTSCGASPAGTNFLWGNDVFYSYTADTNTQLSFTMTPVGITSWSSIFVYQGCETVGVNCVAGKASINSAARVFTLDVTAGVTYTILISSASPTQTVNYKLLIQKDDCLPRPVSLSVSDVTSDTAILSWTNDVSMAGWEVAVQPLGSPMPSGNGESVATNSYNPILNPATQYQFWVRGACSSGGFTGWSGPVAFTTPLCDADALCNYTFRMSNTTASGWGSTRVQVRQNGNVVATLGSQLSSGTGPIDVVVPMCDGLPFDLYWSVSGTNQLNRRLSVLNSFGQTIYIKPSLTVAVGDILYDGVVNCQEPACNIVPLNVTVSDISTTTATMNWDAPATTSWDIYIVQNGQSAPTADTVPTYDNINPDATSFALMGLLPEHSYDVYVRVNCSPEPSSWSAAVTFSTLISCYKPTNPLVSSITATSAVVSWTPALQTDTQFEILMIPGPVAPVQLPETDVPATYPVISVPAGGPYTFTLTDLQPSTIYYGYIRKVCTDDVSLWVPFNVFNTVCDAADKCTYKFFPAAVGGSWYGARVQVRQNGIVLATLGSSVNNANGISVALCNNVPFDLYWSIPGTMPINVLSISIQNPFTDVIFNLAAGEGTPLTVLYSSVANCVPPSCPKPINPVVSNVSATTALLSWTEAGSATQWEVYAAPSGDPQPLNGSPVNGTGYYHVVETNMYTISGLIPQTSYVYYVRSICSANDISTWTLLSPVSFVTKAVNDNCNEAAVVPVNPTMEGVDFVLGSTLGATASPQDGSSCSGSEDDDVWFTFVATSPRHFISINKYDGASIQHALYSGDCGTMVLKYCSNAESSYADGLIVGSTYKIRIYTNVDNNTSSAAFTLTITTPSLTVNDECNTATPISVSIDGSCNTVGHGTLIGATASSQASTCEGNADDDVWFSFVAASVTQVVSLTDIVGSTTNLNHAVYTDTCDNLQLFYCSPANTVTVKKDNYVVGQTYYVRIWSNQAITHNVTFNVCVKNVSSCENSQFYCGSSIGNPYIFNNTTNITGLQQLACLGSAPNPTYYTLRVGTSGPLIFDIFQSQSFDPGGNPLGVSMDVDFVAWGPFVSPQSCSEIAMVDCPSCTSNTYDPDFYPFGNIVDCSYDNNSMETLHIPNAIAGEYYIILITNFSNNPGFIRLRQTNFGAPGAGTTVCADRLQLVAFIDENNNDIKDNAEVNFTEGSFSYQKNDSGVDVNVATSDGQYELVDFNPVNTYDFNYHIFPEFAPYCSLTSTNFNDINIQTGSGNTILYFPITVTTPYNDLSVALVPTGQPVAGFTYTNQVVCKNEGLSTMSGTLTFTNATTVTITDSDLPGTVTTPTGFTYNFTGLAPGENRLFYVTMTVPPIPVVNINDVLTNTVSVQSDVSEIALANNHAQLSQNVLASYDPNDKTESHGQSVSIEDLDNDGYLYYTIRFQNTGNYFASTVRLEDILDDQLDESSIRMVASSHDYTLERIGNQLTWTFMAIALPPESVNEPASHGYVTFRIKPKQGYSIGDVISNTAEIYFDSNPAIVTNTVETEVSTPLGIDVFDISNIVLYPNPANTIVYLNLQHTTENLEQVTLYDVLGKTVKQVKANNSRETAIDVSGLAKGVYMVEIKTENDLKLIKKLVIN